MKRTHLKLYLLVALFLLLALYLYLHQHASRRASVSPRVYVYQDGSYHPLTSLLTQKLDGDLYGRGKIISWHWQPQRIVNATARYHREIQIKANPSLLQNGETTTVRWTNSRPGITLDILALYCPSNSSSNKFIEYWEVSSFRLHHSHRKGEVKIALYNVRVSCEFRIFFINDNVELVAISNKIRFTATPLHLHLSLTGIPTQMRVQWTSGDPYAPVVAYGLTPTNLKYTATGSSRTYTNKDMCGPPANLTKFFLHPGYLHDVLLTNLKENTRYFYRVGGGKSKFSSIRNFTTSLTAGSHDTFKFAVYGDMDITSSPGAETTANHLLRETLQNHLSFVLHIGDICYAEGLAYRWEEWMTMIEPYSSLIPYMVSIGNHDQVTAFGQDPSGGSRVVRKGSVHDSGGECGVPLDYRFHMPDNGNRLWWYSFTYGSVHIIQISSEHDLAPGSVQYLWLKKDLMAIDPLVTPWKIVTLHRPMHTSQKAINEHFVAEQIQRNIEDLLTENHVDLVISGHTHIYERTCQVYKSQCHPEKGLVNVVVGTGGTELEKRATQTLNLSRHFEVSFGYGRITVNQTNLLWEFVRNKDMAIADAVMLTK